MNWKRALGCAATVGCVVALHWLRMSDADLPRATPMHLTDLNWYHFPSFVFVRNALLSGQLPLWNPYQLAGVPFVGLHVTMPFYPLLLIFLPLSPQLAIAAHGILHIALCGLFCWLLARRIGLDLAGAAVTTVSYCTSFAVAIYIFSSPNLSCMAWLPAILWALHGLAEKPGIPRALTFAAVVAMSFLSGFAQGFLYSIQAGALYALFLLASPVTRGKRMGFLIAALGGGIAGGGLIAIQLLPAMELASRSGRNLGGISFGEAAVYGQPSRAMLRSVLGLGKGWLVLPKLMLPLAVCALALRKHRLHAVFFAILFFVLSSRSTTGFPAETSFAFPCARSSSTPWPRRCSWGSERVSSRRCWGIAGAGLPEWGCCSHSVSLSINTRAAKSVSVTTRLRRPRR